LTLSVALQLSSRVTRFASERAKAAAKYQIKKLRRCCSSSKTAFHNSTFIASSPPLEAFGVSSSILRRIQFIANRERARGVNLALIYTDHDTLTRVPIMSVSI
jgi:hypothetical protein